MKFSFTFAFTILIAIAALAFATGCNETPNEPSVASAHNAALAAPYTPGTGISGNSFARRPRFYVPPDNSGGSSTTQPSSGSP